MASCTEAGQFVYIFVLAYFDQDELKFELGEVTSVKCDEKHYVGSIKSQRDIQNGGGLFGDRSYVVIGACVRVLENPCEGSEKSFTVLFSPAGDFF